jgi:hypothetical protein
MQILIKRKTAIPSLLITVGLACFAPTPGAQAVSPAPDGGYPGFNAAEGQSALFSLTTGVANTGVGWSSLKSNTDGSYNTAVGAGTLLLNIGDQNTGDGTANTAVGVGALLSNTTGSYNTANGLLALFSNITGFNNTANGIYALFSNTDGIRNTANGAVALNLNTGSFNTADGADALRYNAQGEGNTAVGQAALENNTTGDHNTALGENAGASLDTGDNNIDIGYNVVGVAGESNTIRIGNTDITDTFIRGISGATVASGAAVLVASNGHLGTVTSSARFKEDIKPMDKASEALFSLKPVTFRYKKELDPAGTQQFGLVAEDVEEVNPKLVVRDEHGKVNSVRYEQINAMLLNEFLKAHRQVQQLETNATEQQKEINLLRLQLKEQRALIQKVNDKVELKSLVPQTIANDP